MEKIKDFSEWVNEACSKKKMNEESDEYKEFFQKKLDKYGVKEPDALSDEDKKKFFDEIDAEWESDKEKEVIDEATLMTPENINKIISKAKKEIVKLYDVDDRVFEVRAMKRRIEKIGNELDTFVDDFSNGRFGK